MFTPTRTPRRAQVHVDGNGARHPEPFMPRLSAAPRRRSTVAIIVAVLAVAGGALAGVVAYKAGSGRQSVLAASREIAAGHVLQPSDLRIVDVSTDGGLSLVLASDEDSVIGRPVGVPIAAGSPLTSGDLAPVPAAGPGEALVGVLCKAGQYPPSIAPGDTVEVIDDAATGSGASAVVPVQPQGAALEATVISVDAPTDTATVGTVITLRMSADAAPTVSREATAGRISLIVVHPGG